MLKAIPQTASFFRTSHVPRQVLRATSVDSVFHFNSDVARSSRTTPESLTCTCTCILLMKKLLVTKGIATRSKDATNVAPGLTSNKKLLGWNVMCSETLSPPRRPSPEGNLIFYTAHAKHHGRPVPVVQRFEPLHRYSGSPSPPSETLQFVFLLDVTTSDVRLITHTHRKLAKERKTHVIRRIPANLVGHAGVSTSSNSSTC